MYNSNDAFKRSINDVCTRLIYSVCNFPVLKFYSRGSSGSLMIWPAHGAKTSLPVSHFHTYTLTQPTCWTPCCSRTAGRADRSEGRRRAAAAVAAVAQAAAARLHFQLRTCCGATATTTALKTLSTILACTVKAHTHTHLLLIKITPSSYV